MSFYVSVINGRRKLLAVGPFRRHGDAIAHVDGFRRWATARYHDLAFAGFGTARHRSGHPPGRCNDAYGIAVDDDGWCLR